MSAPVTSSERIVQARRLVDSLLDAARANSARHKDDVAALLVGVAATVSRRRHTGLFVNREIEDLLLELSMRLPSSLSNGALTERRSEAGRGSALYVMTSCNAHGGHTRLVSRWISMRPEVASSLVLTSPASPAPPSDLVEAIRRSGGEVYRPEGNTLRRASSLRNLALNTDMVVLAAHENDIVPSLALASVMWRPPVVLLNHAEHVFWVGSSIADIVVSLRPAAAELAARRRGIIGERSIEVPLPVPTATRSRGIGDAKRALGIRPDEKLLVTVGWAYKFAPIDGVNLVAALEGILGRPDVRLIAVGPTEAREPWASAKARYGERIRALGPRDTQEVLEAADVYLESFPIGSLTASLEAGMLGVPMVGLSLGAESWPPILREDDPALADHVFTNLQLYRARIEQLLDDPTARSEAGRALKGHVERLHGEAAWSAGVARLFDTARTVARRRGKEQERVVGQPGPEDAILAGVIADNEDRVNRAEMHFTREAEVTASGTYEFLNRRMEQLDSLILAAVPPGGNQYAAAVRIARSATPLRLRLRSALSGVSGKPDNRD